MPLNTENFQPSQMLNPDTGVYNLSSVSGGGSLVTSNKQVTVPTGSPIANFDTGFLIDGVAGDTSVVISGDTQQVLTFNAIIDLEGLVLGVGKVALVKGNPDFRSVIFVDSSIINTGKTLSFSIKSTGTTLSAYMFNEIARVSQINEDVLEAVLGYKILDFPLAGSTPIVTGAIVANGTEVFVALADVADPLTTLSGSDWRESFYTMQTLSTARAQHTELIAYDSYAFDLKNASRVNYAKLGAYGTKTLHGIVMDGHTLTAVEESAYNTLNDRQKAMRFSGTAGAIVSNDYTGLPIASQAKQPMDILLDGVTSGDNSDVQGRVSDDAVRTHKHSKSESPHNHAYVRGNGGSPNTGASGPLGFFWDHDSVVTGSVTTNMMVQLPTEVPTASENLIKTVVGSPWILAILA